MLLHVPEKKCLWQSAAFKNRWPELKSETLFVWWTFDDLGPHHIACHRDHDRYFCARAYVCKRVHACVHVCVRACVRAWCKCAPLIDYRSFSYHGHSHIPQWPRPPHDDETWEIYKLWNLKKLCQKHLLKMFIKNNIKNNTRSVVSFSSWLIRARAHHSTLDKCEGWSWNVQCYHILTYYL